MREIRIALVLSVLAFAVYCANGHAIPTGDSEATALMPVVLLTQGNLLMDGYAPYYIDHFGPDSTHFLFRSRYGLVPIYPIATGLAITPLYALPVWLYGRTPRTIAERVHFAERAEKPVAAFVTALSVGFFYLLARRLGLRHRGWAAALTLAFAFATEAWSTHSQALWQHGMGILALLAASLLALRHVELPTLANGFAFGAACALALAVRPANALFVLPLWCWTVLRPRPRWLALGAACAAAPIVVGVALIAYNLLLFGRATSGYFWTASPSPGAALLAVLWSPGRGLFVYFPLALLGILGAVRVLRSGVLRRSIYAPWILFVAAQVVLVASFANWWGGFSYGPRLLSEIEPFLLLLAIPLIEAGPGPLFKAAFWLLLAWSAAVQAVGAFCYTGWWNAAPKNVDAAPERNWDWQDNPITRDMHRLPRLVREAQRTLLPPRPLRDWRASYEVQPELTLTAGQIGWPEVVVHNLGGETWADYTDSTGANDVRLAYHLREAAGRRLPVEGEHSELRRIVWPGQTAAIYPRVQAPAAPGRYVVEFSLVQERVDWFESRGVPPGELRLSVIAAPPPAPKPGSR
jgi:hypothetical protein